MGAVLEGFATIGTVIALGALLAHLRVLDLSSQVLLSRLAFFVASPALMVTVLEDTDVREVFSPNLAATAVGVVVAGTAYVVVARLLFVRDLGGTVIGTLSATYVNAGNLGLPIAAYVLGDVALVAPTLLLQMLVMQPIALAVLDHATTPGRVSVRRVLSQPFRTPLTVASLIGLALAVTGPSCRGCRGPAGPGRRDGGAGDAARVRRLAAARPQARCGRLGRRARLDRDGQAAAAAGRGVPRRPGSCSASRATRCSR